VISVDGQQGMIAVHLFSPAGGGEPVTAGPEVRRYSAEAGQEPLRVAENLYVVGMNELFAKDAAFFHDNFAGSLTKRVLNFAARFEDFVDTLAFSVVAHDRADMRQVIAGSWMRPTSRLLGGGFICTGRSTSSGR